MDFVRGFSTLLASVIAHNIILYWLYAFICRLHLNPSQSFSLVGNKLLASRTIGLTNLDAEEANVGIAEGPTAIDF
tara:strand:- start:1220 stop:1447 length:228 start_codon:yes stop_codon:yes gene_type:complete